MFKRFLSILASVSIAVSMAAPAFADTDTTYTSNLKAHFIDVGQADSEFIELPNGKTMLIDAGNNPDGIDVVNYIKATGPHKN